MALYYQGNRSPRQGRVYIRDQRKDLLQDNWQALYHIFILSGIVALFECSVPYSVEQNSQHANSASRK